MAATVVASSVVGTAAFVLAAVVTGAVVLLAAGLNRVSDDGLRTAIAWTAFAVACVAGVATLLAVPRFARTWGPVQPLLVLAIAGVLLGLVAHRYFGVLSVVNDCIADASVPYGWIRACSESA
jgi:hypothetical protein